MSGRRRGKYGTLRQPEAGSCVCAQACQVCVFACEREYKCVSRCVCVNESVYMHLSVYKREYKYAYVYVSGISHQSLFLGLGLPDYLNAQVLES